MRKIVAGILKEFWLLKRDVHALLVLFVMPAAFILIMSLAMRDAFSEHSAVHIKAIMVDEENSTASREMIAQFAHIEGFEWSVNPQSSELSHTMMERDVLISVVVKKGFEKTLLSNGDVAKCVTVLVDPKATPMVRMLFESAIAGSVAKISMINQMSALNPWMTSEEKGTALRDRQWFEEQFFQGEKRGSLQPTSVQQSVPAWLIFSMFFIIIPISHTFVNERRLGTLARLAVMNVSITSLLVSKFIPYFLINQIQFFLMLMVGIYLVPILGGDALIVGDVWGGLIVVSIVLSFATITYALAIASIVRTTDQAVSIGGLLNIIFAALGGIMIPLFVMPDFMQNLAIISPMSWALKAFLALFLHQVSIGELIFPLGGLMIFGTVCLSFATYRLHKELKEAQ
ncbi:MAG: ABC transporter permease [Sulfuricurvum sp.]|uniref:ABC transporter permease n=1 Tax=Sulfuricurvum sp. TaxID=2025608 RepID=UPI0026285E93|nr:ABC transporter permease [Sulfuricurvum sp.]MDD2829454.1 ABC transporter permease [Sulfuricurvum sp.]MDD4948463.1 ABC transporter permease [Sulfuricurvum sp.]